MLAEQIFLNPQKEYTILINRFVAMEIITVFSRSDIRQSRLEHVFLNVNRISLFNSFSLKISTLVIFLIVLAG